VRAVTVVTLAVLALALVAGCGGDDPPPARSAFAERLAQLCEETRLAVEDLGEPREEGAAVFAPWARIGLGFVADVRRLPAATQRQRKDIVSLATYYKGFYDNLRASYDQYEEGQSQVIKMSLQHGYALLASAERLATRMGAPECAERPFEAES
jgi:hypothetical protein